MVLIIVIDILRPASPEDRLFALRVEMKEARVVADSCRLALEDEAADVLAGDARIDSLGRVIANYESLDPRGVPVDSYEAYIRTFEAYNDGNPGLGAAEDSLRTHRAACVIIIDHHNQLADSARALAAELGLLQEQVRE